MAHTYVSNIVHCVFSTKERRRTIRPEYEERLWAFLGGIARKNGFKVMAVGGAADHVHVLLSLPATIALAKAIQLLKGGSSKWVHETFREAQLFEWQEGYGAFSVGVSQVKGTVSYIERQKEHHRKKTFEDEYRLFLTRHGIAYDEKYVCG